MYQKLISTIQSHLRFSTREANGFVVIMAIVLASLFAPLVLKKIWKQPSYDFSKDEMMLDSLSRLLAVKVQNTTFSKKPEYQKQETVITPHLFDPNTATIAELQALGLPEKVVNNLNKFRSKGGKFLTKKDFAKIYGLDQNVYVQLKDYLQLPDTLVKKQFEKKTFTPFPPREPKAAKAIIDINKADTTQLIALKGIGSKLAARIIKFRNGLGGIINTGQYKEIFGLDSLVIAELSKQTFIEPSFEPIKLDLRYTSLIALQLHPYLSKREATVLYNYVQQHPEINSPTKLLDIKGIDQEKLKKLIPYINFSDEK